MSTELRPLSQSVESLRQQLIGRVSELSVDKQAQRPSPKDWSPLEVMEHLVQYDELLVGWIPLAQGKRISTTFKSRVFTKIVVWAMKSPFRTPSGLKIEPTGGLTFEALLQRWNAARDTLEANLEAIPANEMEFAFVIHEIAGPLSAKMTLELTESHLIYHLRHFPKV